MMYCKPDKVQINVVFKSLNVVQLVSLYKSQFQNGIRTGNYNFVALLYAFGK